MTDWELITAQIKKAMAAVDDAHAAGDALREQPSMETLDAFQVKMHTLCEHLEAMKYTMEHEDDVFMDELVDSLSQIFTGQPAPYRKTPRTNSNTAAL